MTLYLPENIPQFREVFKEVCERILKSEQDAVFYALYVELIAKLRDNSLLKKAILEIEKSLDKEKETFCQSSLEAVEDSWLRLWKYHRRSLKYRKKLVAIKRMITSPNQISFLQLYPSVSFALWEFRYHSPLCRGIEEAPFLFRRVLSDLKFSFTWFKYLHPKKEEYFCGRLVSRGKPLKRDKRKMLKSRMFTFDSKHVRPITSVDRLPSAIYSPKVLEVEQKFLIAGCNDYERVRNMLSMAEIDFTSCWKRVRFLEGCVTVNDTLSVPNRINGRWGKIRSGAWQAAFEQSEKEALIAAQMAFKQNLALGKNSLVNSFVCIEGQINRKRYEKYLCSLQNHISAHLYKIENAQHVEGVLIPSTQKEAFVIDLSSQYWKKHPKAKYSEVYRYYKANCPKDKRLSENYWQKIVRKYKIDPRKKEEKVRGPKK